MKLSRKLAVLALALPLTAVGCGGGSKPDPGAQSAFASSMASFVGSSVEIGKIGAAACDVLAETHGDRLKVDAMIVAADANPVLFHAAVKNAAYTICPKYQAAVARW